MADIDKAERTEVWYSDEEVKSRGSKVPMLIA